MSDYQSSIVESYKHCHLPSLVESSNANAQRDFFLFIVFCNLYDATSPKVLFNFNRPLTGVDEFKNTLSSVKQGNRTSSAVFQSIDTIEKQIHSIDPTNLVEDINRLIAELSHPNFQYNHLSNIEALELYRKSLLPLQEMNIENSFNTPIEPLRLSSVYSQLLNEINRAISKARMYLPFDADIEASASILSSKAKQAVDVEAVQQSPLHILRMLALLHSEDVNIINSHCLQSGHESFNHSKDLAVKITKLPKVINKSEIIKGKVVSNDEDNISNNNDNSAKAINKGEINLPRYTEFNVANSLTPSLSSKGCGYIFLVQNALNRQSDEEERAKLVKSGYVSAVITLPQKLFSQQTYELVLIILKRNSRFIRFINAVDFYTVSEKKHALARLDELTKLINAKGEVEGRSIDVPLNIITNNNCSLNPVAYKELYRLEDAGIDKLKDERLELLKKLESTQTNIDMLITRFTN